MSAQAVYNVLAALVDVGLVRRIEPAGSPARYEVRVGDNHHHVVCRPAGPRPTSTAPWAGARVSPRRRQPAIVLDEAEVTFWGLCPDCQTGLTRHAPIANAQARRDRTTAAVRQKTERSLQSKRMEATP